MSRKRARGRLRAPGCNPGNAGNPGTWSPAAVRWAHCEWFMSWLDAPFFECSEFNEVLESMDLFPDGGIATRAEWGRLRAAMCNAFEAYAAPRRLSQSYLQMERRDLELYRADARAAMRGKRLPAASDPVSGAPFKPEWFARYRHPPPYVPDTDAKLIVKVGTQLRPATFVSLADSTSIHSNQMVRVRFSDTNQVTEVYDLDVMLHDTPLIPHSASDAIPNASGVAMDEGSSAIPVNFGLRTPPGTRRVSFVSAPNTPLLAGVGNNVISHHHHQNRRGSIFNPLVSVSPRSNGNGTPPNATNNHDDEDDGQHHQTNHSNSPGNVLEAEVDVGRLASLMRLVERRQEVVETLRRANDTGEEEVRMTGAVTNNTRTTIENSVAMLAELSNRSEQLLPQQGVEPAEPQHPSLPQLQPSPSAGHPHAPLASLQPSPNAAPSPSLSLPFDAHPYRGVAQKLEDAFTDVLPNTPTIPIPPPSATRVGIIHDTGLSPRTNTAYPTNNNNVNININHHDNMNGNSNGGIIPQGPSPEVVAATRGIDSNSIEGSINYGKVITNACIAKYAKFGKINDMPQQHHSDVVDCVAVCVALLHRARVTQDPDAIDELIGILKGRFPNFPDTIHNANVELRRRKSQQQQYHQEKQAQLAQQGQQQHQYNNININVNSTAPQGSSAAGPSAIVTARTLQ